MREKNFLQLLSISISLTWNRAWLSRVLQTRLLSRSYRTVLRDCSQLTAKTGRWLFQYRAMQGTAEERKLRISLAKPSVRSLYKVNATRGHSTGTTLKRRFEEKHGFSLKNQDKHKFIKSINKIVQAWVWREETFSKKYSEHFQIQSHLKFFWFKINLI